MYDCIVFDSLQNIFARFITPFPLPAPSAIFASAIRCVGFPWNSPVMLYPALPDYFLPLLAFNLDLYVHPLYNLAVYWNNIC